MAAGVRFIATRHLKLEPRRVVAGNGAVVVFLELDVNEEGPECNGFYLGVRPQLVEGLVGDLTKEHIEAKSRAGVVEPLEILVDANILRERCHEGRDALETRFGEGNSDDFLDVPNVCWACVIRLEPVVVAVLPLQGTLLGLVFRFIVGNIPGNLYIFLGETDGERDGLAVEENVVALYHEGLDVNTRQPTHSEGGSIVLGSEGLMGGDPATLC